MEPKTDKHNISQWSVDHPYNIIAFFLAVIILAFWAIGFSLPRRMMPYVESPTIGVVTMMPGLSAREMEIYLSKPIEEQLLNIKNLRYLRSSSQDGFSIVSLEFYYGTDMKKALFDVQSLMNIIQANLPTSSANLKPSWVVAIDPLNLPILTFNLTAPGWDSAKLREFADNTVINRLKTVPDVYAVSAFGGFRRQLQVVVDRNKLAAYGLSILDVKTALDQYNVSRPGGTLTYSTHEAIIRLDSRAKDAQTVSNYPVKAMPGQVVYVKDVATVTDSYWEPRAAYNYASPSGIQPGIAVEVVQNPAASSAQVVPRIMKEIQNLERENPGIKFSTAYDNAHFVNILFKNMFEELGLAILLAGLVIFLFLGDWRGTLISLTTIPTSLAIAILGLIPLGMSLNSGTLIGLLLSIGRLVDDSIIDIHSVTRHLKMGKKTKEAAVDGITEVRLPVLASTFMICLALSPLLFCGGIVQLMFRELVWPIILALLASALVSFTLTSLMAAHLLRKPQEIGEESQKLSAPVQNFLNRLENNYQNLLGWMLKHRFVNLCAVLAVLIIGCGFYFFIGSEMMPLGDVGQAYGIMEAQPGTSFEQTKKMALQLEKIMLKYPEIEKVSAKIGSETMFESFSPVFTGYAMPEANGADFMLTLSDKEKRKKSIWQVIDAVQKEALEQIPGLRRLQIKEMGADVMATSQAPIQLLVFGKDLNLIDKISREVKRIADQTKGFYQGAVDWVVGNPAYEVKVDPARAAEQGLSVNEISRQCYYAMRGGLTDEFYRLPNIRQNTILIRYPQSERKDAFDLENMYLTTPEGKTVPLKAVAEIVKTQEPTLIEHDGLRRVNAVTGFYRPGGPPSMDLSMDIMMKAMSQINFPPGYGLEMRGDMTQMMDSFRRLFWGLGFALLFMFLILVAQFRGFLSPLQMLFSLPLELSGVFFGLWLLHQAFSTVSIMAVIVLTGMDITTAILLIDMIMLYRDRGLPRDQAIMEAAPQRLRPILMTSLITIIVMFPVAFFPRTGMDAYSSLGTVIVFGLLVGTFLSLLVIPIMHTYLDDFLSWLYRRFLGREWQWPVKEENK